MIVNGPGAAPCDCADDRTPGSAGQRSDSCAASGPEADPLKGFSHRMTLPVPVIDMMNVMMIIPVSYSSQVVIRESN
jgi:hypothetical protein